MQLTPPPQFLKEKQMLVRQPHKSGFTLVELSIVLVIVGLLIGGILVAQSLIDSARVGKLVRDIGQYEIAINNFKMNFRHYPGDSPHFTPAGDGDDSTDHVNCNGSYSGYESVQYWAHLSQSGMISEDYVAYSPQSCGGGPSP